MSGIRRTPPIGSRALATASLLVAGLTAACSGGGGSDGGSSLNITSCSLGCTVGQTNQASCGVTDIYVNQEIRVAFTRAVDPATIDNNTFQVANLDSGAVPPATFSIDPNDPRIVIYRPQLTFDSSGNPVFGLEEDETYVFKVPGQSLDNIGPYIRSQAGRANQTRLLCTLEATRGIFDANPGPPRVEVLVDIVASRDSNGDPDVIDFDQPAPGATDVWRDSDILLEFDDVMNPATLVNPISGISNTISVRIDPDGDLSDTSDQIELPGAFSISIDQNAQTTTVVFTPDGGFPSSGTDPDFTRRILIRLPDTIQDLGGNALVNSGTFSFTTEVIDFDPLAIEEDFESNTREDSTRTGSLWNVDGLLLAGQDPDGSAVRGGGSGRLGDLRVPSGVTVTLNTDLEDFTAPEFDDLAVYDPRLIIDPTLFGQPESVTGGVFEFSSLQVDAGGVLRLEGTNPGRVLVRGQTIVQGVVDVAGQAAADHESTTFLGGLGGQPGAGGGAGGQGGARPDGEGIGGVDNPNDPAVYDDVNGAPGEGIPWPNSISPTDFRGEGPGGLAWPQPTSVDPSLGFPMDIFDLDGMQFEQRQRCAVIGPGGVGEGAAYALDGTDGDYEERLNGQNQVDPFTEPPTSGGGDADELTLGDAERKLDPNEGFLRGAAGGGGGGGHLQESRNNGQILNDCTMPSSGMLQLVETSTHSSAGGGGGGGAVQLQSGRRIVHNGILDASGGDGGSFVVGGTELSAPGGAGAGGAILFQSPGIQIQNVPGRFDVRAGLAGLGVNGSLGGASSPGLLRFENFGTPLNLLNEAGKILPSIDELEDVYGVGPEAILSVGNWVPSGLGAEGLSGAQSCWIRPTGNFFVLVFEEDDPVSGEPGWDMSLILDGFDDPQSYRGDNDLFNDTLENVWGNTLGDAPVVVRFQGARVAGSLPNPCDVILNGSGSPILPGSLTGWVDHPSDLNTFFGGDPRFAPNIIRFVVVWDATQAEFMELRGIEEITFTALPD